MADTKQAGIAIVRELVATPNGQIRVVSAVMLIYPSYHLFTHLKIPDNLAQLLYVMLGIGLFLMVLSSLMAVIAARASDRRLSDDREKVPVSQISLEFAQQIASSINLGDMGTLKPHAADMGKTKSELLNTIARLRGREACTDGSVVYYNDMHAVPRNPANITTFKET